VIREFQRPVHLDLRHVAPQAIRGVAGAATGTVFVGRVVTLQALPDSRGVLRLQRPVRIMAGDAGQRRLPKASRLHKPDWLKPHDFPIVGPDLAGFHFIRTAVTFGTSRNRFLLAGLLPERIVNGSLGGNVFGPRSVTPLAGDSRADAMPLNLTVPKRHITGVTPETTPRLGLVEQHAQPPEVTRRGLVWLAWSHIESFDRVIPRPAKLEQVRRAAAVGQGRHPSPRMPAGAKAPIELGATQETVVLVGRPGAGVARRDLRPLRQAVWTGIERRQQ